MFYVVWVREKRCWRLINSVIIINNLAEKLKRMSSKGEFSFSLPFHQMQSPVLSSFLVFVFTILFETELRAIIFSMISFNSWKNVYVTWLVIVILYASTWSNKKLWFWYSFYIICTTFLKNGPWVQCTYIRLPYK